MIVLWRIVGDFASGKDSSSANPNVVQMTRIRQLYELQLVDTQLVRLEAALAALDDGAARRAQVEQAHTVEETARSDLQARQSRLRIMSGWCPTDRSPSASRRELTSLCGSRGKDGGISSLSRKSRKSALGRMTPSCSRAYSTATAESTRSKITSPVRSSSRTTGSLATLELSPSGTTSKISVDSSAEVPPLAAALLRLSYRCQDAMDVPPADAEYLLVFVRPLSKEMLGRCLGSVGFRPLP